MKATERVSRFMAETNYKHLPQEAIHIAKRAFLDYMGVTIAGSNEPGPKILAEHIRRMGASAEAGVICGGFQTFADLSAWVNGTASHALDYDDTFPNAVGYNFHPTVPILPGVLALGEKMDASGADVLTAYIVGIEVESRVGAAIGPHGSRIGWHPTPVLGTMGAVAASANILRLDAGQARMALGIASSLAGGLLQNFGTMTKPLHAGNSARNGVVAALLAQYGFTANEDIMEGKFGFCSMFSGGKAYGIGDKEQDLGETWRIISPGMSLKPYPCCRSTHSSIDASLYLKNVMGIDTSQIVKIVCKTSPDHPKLAKFHKPLNAYEGKFSIPYCIATALRRGKVLLEDFTDEKVTDVEIQALLSKVDFEYPDEYIQDTMNLTQEVVVKLGNGTEYSRKVEVPKGDPESPLTDEELSAKFIDCTRSALSQMEIEKVLEMVGHLESLKSISELMKLITFRTELGEDKRCKDLGF
jgi:2-methylcitrate dehydratase PrpD